MKKFSSFIHIALGAEPHNSKILSHKSGFKIKIVSAKALTDIDDGLHGHVLSIKKTNRKIIIPP